MKYLIAAIIIFGAAYVVSTDPVELEVAQSLAQEHWGWFLGLCLAFVGVSAFLMSRKP